MSKELSIEISDISSPASVSSNDQELVDVAADESSQFKPSHGTADSPMNVENVDVADDKVPHQPRGPRTPPDSPPDEDNELSIENPEALSKSPAKEYELSVEDLVAPFNSPTKEYNKLSVANPRAHSNSPTKYYELSVGDLVASPNSPSTNNVSKPRKGPRTPPNSPPPDDDVPEPSRKGPRTPPNSPPHIQIDTCEEPVHFLPENSPYYGIDCSYYLTMPEHRSALEVALNRLQLIRRFTRKVRDLGDLSSYLPAVTTFRAPRLTYEEFISIVPNQTPQNFLIFNEDLERIDRAAENFRRLMMPPPSPRARGDFGIQTSSSKKNSKAPYTKKCSKVQSTSSAEQSEPQLTPETSGTKSVAEVVKEVNPSSDEISVVYEGPTNVSKAGKHIEIVLSDSSNSSPEGQNVAESEDDCKHTAASSVKDANNVATMDEDKDDGYMSSSQHENPNRALNPFSKEDLKRRYMSQSSDEDPKPKYTHTSTSGDYVRLSSSASTDEEANNDNIPKPSDKHQSLTHTTLADQDKDFQTEKSESQKQPVNITNLELIGNVDFKNVRSSVNLPRIQIDEPSESVAESLIKPLLTSAAAALPLTVRSESSVSSSVLDYTVKLKQFENFTDDEDTKSPQDCAEKSPESEQISSKNSESESGTLETDSSSRQSENDETVVESETSSQVHSQESKVDDEKSTAAESKDPESISFQTLSSVSPLKHRNKDDEQKDPEDPENVSPRKKSRKSTDDISG